ncbi:hypothetical protein LCGC14_2889790 [marine sediment metagenome]|uniref:Uncharacterized protein n=1 Tax=marine sediment metagenome TaxID=412755 RepID=A0A0F8YJF9_9ZZZZ
MISTDLIRLLADLGGLGVLALFLIIGGVLIRSGIGLFRDQVLPLVRNHLTHLEDSYDRLADSLGKHADAIDNMQHVQSAQAAALETHNELTRQLIERLPKNHKVKRLLD